MTFGVTRPNWFEQAIAEHIASNDPSKIAQAIATNPRFLNAIADGLNNPPAPGIRGKGHSAIIRDAVAAAIVAD